MINARRNRGNRPNRPVIGVAWAAPLGWNGRVHSVELLLDDALDGTVRGQWAALLDAGLPSQGRHAGPSNRPHVTLALAHSLSDPTALAGAVVALPTAVTLGGFVVFGRSRFVLARLVVASPALLRLQSSVRAALADPVDPRGSFAEGRWTGHVTLAKRLTSSQLGTALDVLGGARDVDGALVRARTWDIDARIERELVPPLERSPGDATVPAKPVARERPDPR